MRACKKESEREREREGESEIPLFRHESQNLHSLAAKGHRTDPGRS